MLWGAYPPAGAPTHRRRKMLERSGARRAGSELAVDPDASGSDPAEPLAPGRDRLACVGDADLAVVPVDLFEPVGGLVARARGGVGESDRRAPGRTAILRTAVPDVPGVRVVAVGRLHVPRPHVATPG